MDGDQSGKRKEAIAAIQARDKGGLNQKEAANVESKGQIGNGSNRAHGQSFGVGVRISMHCWELG